MVPANLHPCQTVRPHPVMTMSKQPEDQGHSKINLTNLPQSLCAAVDFSQRLMHGNVREGDQTLHYDYKQFVFWFCVGLCKANSRSEKSGVTNMEINSEPK